MKRTLFSIALCSLTAMAITVSCIDVPHDVEDFDYTFTLGAYFLNAGNPGENDADLTQLNTLYSIVNQHCFAGANNGAKLGDDGSDLLAYGSHLFIALQGSKKIAVVNKFTCQSETTITVESDEAQTLSPCHLTAFEGGLLCTFKEGYVARIDTVSLKAEVLQEIDAVPGGICIANQKLYVSCYRPLNIQDGSRGNSVLMFNPVDLHVMKSIDVNDGPRDLVVDPYTQGVFVLCEGTGEGGSVQHIDSDNDETKVISGIEKPLFLAAGFEKTVIICCDGRDDLDPKRFIKVDSGSLKENGSFISDGSYIMSPCALFVDSNTSNVYIAENPTHQTGMIYIYTSFGQYITSFNTAGSNPCAAVFVTSND